MGNAFNKGGKTREALETLRGKPRLSAEDAEDGCAKIFTIAVNDPMKATKLADLGACKLIVDVMKVHNHSENVSVAHQWIKSISALTRNCQKSSGYFSRAGLCPVLLSILRIHASSADFVEYWCNVVGNIAVLEENRVALGNLGACEALVHVLENILLIHPDGNGIAQWGSKAAENLCLGPYQPNIQRLLQVHFPEVATRITTNGGFSEQTKAIASRALLCFGQ